MSEEVLVALIGLAGVVIGALFGYLGNSRKQAVINAQHEQKQQDQFAAINEWMARVDKKLDEHNRYAEKFAEANKSMAIIAERQSSIQRDIEHLKKGSKS